jgi:hypothetical protein
MKKILAKWFPRYFNQVDSSNSRLGLLADTQEVTNYGTSDNSIVNEAVTIELDLLERGMNNAAPGEVASSIYPNKNSRAEQLFSQLKQQLNSEFVSPAWYHRLLVQEQLLYFLTERYPFYSTRIGLHTFLRRLWPAVLAGMMLHDFIQFSTNSDRRYGTTAGDIFGGFYRREWGTASGFYDGFPNQPGFWGLPLFLILTPATMVLLEKLSMNALLSQTNKITAILNVTCQAVGITLSERINSHYTSYEEGNVPSVLERRPNPQVHDRQNYGWVQALPYSLYRRSLVAASYLLAWKFQHLSEQSREDYLEKLKKIAKSGPLVLALPAIAAIAQIADRSTPSLLENLFTTQAQNNNLAEHIVNAKQVLNELTNSPSVWRREIAHYYQWAARGTTTAWRHAAYNLLNFALWGGTAYLVYRYGQLLIQRMQQAAEFFRQQYDCNGHRVWNYSPVTGNYDCTVCGHFNFVPPQLANDPQACLDALLAFPRSPAELSSALSHLKNFSGFRHFDLSVWTQNLTNWDATTTQQIFQNILSLSPQWDIVNISSPTLNPLWPSDNNLQIIGQELSHVVIRIFDGTRLNFGSDQWREFLNAWDPLPGLQGMFVGYNFDEQGMYDFANWITNHTLLLNYVSAPGNSFSDNAGLAVLNVLNPNQTSLLDYSSSQLTGQFLTPFSGWLSHSRAENVILSNNDFTGGDYAGLGQAIAQAHQLTDFSLSNTNMYDEDFANLAQPWQNKSIALRHFNAANNFATGEGVYAFSISAGCNIKTVNWAGNLLSDSDLPRLQILFPQVCWERVDFSRNTFTSSGIGELWFSFINTMIRAIWFAGMNLDRHAFEPMITLLNNGSLILDDIDVSDNLMPNELASQFINIACQRNVGGINVANNGLSAIFSNINNWPVQSYSCNFINLSKNLLNDAELLPFLHRVPEMLALKGIDVSDCASVGDGTARELPHLFMMPVPNPDDFNNPQPPVDEVRAWNKTKSTQFEVFIMRNTQITQQGVIPIRNLIPHISGVIEASSDEVDINSSEYIQTSCANRAKPFWSRFAFWRNPVEAEQALQFDETIMEEMQTLETKWNTESNVSRKFIPENNTQLFNQPNNFLASGNNNNISAGLLFSAVPILNAILLLILLYQLVKAISSSSTLSFWKKPNTPTDVIRQETDPTLKNKQTSQKTLLYRN